MLSAFILGLAAGAWLIRDVTDRSRDPLRVLGGIQVMMGLSALISLPLYTLSFDIMALLVQTLPGQPGGYGLFNVSRYGLCLLVMLPATTLAGMTLPLITGSLLRAGLGEKAIGHVYGVNTMGSVMGAALAALVGLPFLGLKGLIVAGSALDVLLGLWLLSRSRGPGRRRWFAPAAALAASAAVFAGIGCTVSTSRPRSSPAESSDAGPSPVSKPTGVSTTKTAEPRQSRRTSAGAMFSAPDFTGQ
jgi:hypothetical protein